MLHLPDENDSIQGEWGVWINIRSGVLAVNDVSPGPNIPALTGIRGIAALYVITFHYFGHSETGGNFQFFGHGYIAVDLFFVLSGFVMALSYQHMFAGHFSFASYRKFLGRRIARIYPIYFITTLAALALFYFGVSHSVKWGVASDKIWAVKFLINVALVQAWGIANSINLPAWSLSAEWAAYVLFPILVVPCLFKSAATAWVFAAFSVAVLAAVAIYSGHTTPYGSPATLRTDTYRHGIPVFRCLSEFSLGLIAFRFAGLPWGRFLRSSSFASPVICLTIFVLLWWKQSDLAIVLLFPFLVISLASGAAHIPGRLLSTRPAAYLGNLSYSVYLIHLLVRPLIDFIYQTARAHGVAHGHIIGGVLALVLALILAHFSYHLIEAPGRRMLRTLFEGRARTEAESAPAGEAWESN